ncbi:MAG: AAA family ATPase [Alphaproteobacteria bacterium]|nr:AAA family ATPase [Alphaproteobacteria bacterium]
MTEPAAPRQAPARWSEAEEAQLAEGLRAGLDLAALATAHGRSVGAIESRLQQLGLYDYTPYNTAVQESAVASAEGSEPTSGKPWREDDVAQLLATFHTRTQSPSPEADLRTLAATLGRSPRALVLKLVQLGALQPTVAAEPVRRIVPPKAPAPKPKPTAPTPPRTLQKITVTPEFQTALAALKEGENLLVLGKAGTGKSTFLRWVKAQLASKSPVLLAPTGMAALQVGGQTVHSFFGLKPRLMQGTSDDWHKPRNPKIYGQLQLLIIDEISMVRADVLDAVDRFLRSYGPRKKVPFGGVQVLLVGDVGQLPPVVRREEAEEFHATYSTPFFFSSNAWAYGSFGTVAFTHVFRQADADFVALLNAVREGQLNGAQLAVLNERVSAMPPSGSVILAARNATVERINSAELAKLPGIESQYTAIKKGSMEETALTTPALLQLKVGAHVMFTRNDPNGRWVNGTLGIVQKLLGNAVEVRISAGPTTGEVHRVEPVTWEATRFRLGEDEQPVAEVAGSFTQLPLTLAWAVTIHKAQGQTLPQVLIDLADGGTFAEGQLYVALSRATSLAALHLTQPIEPKHLKTHPAVMDFLHALGTANHAA